MRASRQKTNGHDPSPWPADEIKRQSVAQLVPYARNTRIHSDEQVDQIAASIREWGWTTPVLVDEDGSIIAGHARVMAAEKLELAEVPVMVAHGWSEAQKNAYRIADNKLSENGEWNNPLLRLEIGDLSKMEFDMSLIGFSAAELKAFTWPGQEVDDPEAEWVGMPGYNHEDKTAYRTLIIHFKDQESVDEFSRLVEQNITPKTRFMWFPIIEIERYTDKKYAAE